MDATPNVPPLPGPGSIDFGPVHRKYRRFWLEYESTEPAERRPRVPVPPAAGRGAPLAPAAPPGRTALALTILGAALVLGALGDGLLRAPSWGLNVLLWTAALLLAALAVVRWRRLRLDGEGRWLVAPILFFAAAFAWRDSPTLKLCNGLALLAALSLAALYSRQGQLRSAGLFAYALDSPRVALATTIGFLALFGDIRWGELSRDRWYGPWLAAGRGLALALPPLFVFGGLFAAADAAFEGLVHDLFRWNVAELLEHLFFIAFFTWPVGGLLRVALVDRGWMPDGRPASAGGGVGLIEVGVVLGLLNALFLAFVIVQARYFFGGAATVAASPELTYAEYARRGFFELVTVSALVLPLLLLAHWMVDKRDPRHERRFRLLAGSLVLLLFLVMASAILRMRLYQDLYGQTELRLYTTAFMFWLAAVFAWFLATVLRGRRDQFAFGALASGFAAVALLNALNPDASIVHTNAGRALVADTSATPARRTALEPLDERYLVGLSADAVPALIDALPTLSPPKRAIVAQQLVARWSPPPNPDWRAWSWGRSEAWRAVREHQAGLGGGPRPAR